MSHTGGAVITWSIGTTLPAGLACVLLLLLMPDHRSLLTPACRFDTSTGTVSGTPTGVSASTSYSVTATNTGGSAIVNLVIQIVDGPSSLLLLLWASISPILLLCCAVPPSALTYANNPVVYVRGTKHAAWLACFTPTLNLVLVLLAHQDLRSTRTTRRTPAARS